jgi:hypothetical protein
MDRGMVSAWRGGLDPFESFSGSDLPVPVPINLFGYFFQRKG